MIIRQAQPKDSVFVAKLILEPMKPLALALAQTTDTTVACKLLEILFLRRDSQYSYLNTLVCELEGVIAGSVTGYDGARLRELRKPVDDYIAAHKNPVVLTEETGPGEFYLDTISVGLSYRGRGIASLLIQSICVKASREGHQYIGLIVDPENTGARRLYAKEGFLENGTREFAGKTYLHLTRELVPANQPATLPEALQ